MDENISKIKSRIPPNDIEAEQGVLGSMFFGVEAINIAYETIRSDDFYRNDHKVIFDCMIELFISNIPVDLITLKSKLDEKNLIESVGGKEYLVILAGSVSTSVNIKHYLKIVKEKSILRKLIRASNEISIQSYEGKDSIDDIIDNAERKFFNIIQNRNIEDFYPINKILVKSIENLQKLVENQGILRGISTGFIDFDKKMAGLQVSDLILVAGRPSMGKTTFALNIVQNVAIRNNIETAVFSLEMSKEQLVNRILCSEAMIDAQKMRTGDISDEDWDSITLALGPLSEAPLYIDDTPSISLIEIRAKCRRLKLEKGLGLVVIDYLQLMSGNDRNVSRQQEISEISRGLKALAREMEVPVLALSQLSRACETRSDHRPILSDLRESGAIEQDADVVVFLYRDEYYNPDTDKKNMAEIIIAKQRNGPTGIVDLKWLGKYTKFVNMVR